MGEVKEVHVGLDESLSKQFNSEFLRRNFVCEREIAFLFEVSVARGVGCAAQGVASLLGGSLAGVLLDDVLLGGGNKFVFLLGLCLFLNLSNAGVRVDYWLNFHICFKSIIGRSFYNRH